MGLPEDAEKSLDPVREAGVKFLLGIVLPALFGAVKFLNLPILKQIVTWIFRTAFDAAWGGLERVLVFGKVDAMTAGQAEAYRSASDELRAAIKSGDEEAKKRLNEKFNAALGNLVHYAGSSTQ